MKHISLVTSIFLVSSLYAMEPGRQPATLAGNPALTRLLDELTDAEDSMSGAETAAAVALGIGLNAGVITVGSRLLTTPDRFVPLAVSPEMLKVGIEGLGAIVSGVLVYQGWLGLKRVLWLPQEQRLKALEEITARLKKKVESAEKETEKRFAVVENSVTAVEAGAKATIARVFAHIDGRHATVVTRHQQQGTALEDIISAFRAGSLTLGQLQALQSRHSDNARKLDELLQVSQDEIKSLTPAKSKNVFRKIEAMFAHVFTKGNKSSTPHDS